MSTAASTHPLTFDSIGPSDRVSRHLVARQLSTLKRGEVVLNDALGSETLGEASDLRATLTVNNARFFRQAVLGGTLSVADSYIRGDWDCDSLTNFFRIFVRNRDRATKLDQGIARLLGLGHRLYHWWNENTREGSRKNIAAHYDLGNNFYRLWLDETMAYSSGVFPSPTASMREASVEKFDRICRKLDLQLTDHLVEIGTGWGGMAIHAAKHYGCRVTTTTISREQFEVARQRIDAEGLSDRITLLLKDYRDLEGQFDKLVSIEMIEAVGHKFLGDYFAQCGKLLKPEGSMVIQAIVMPERDHQQYLKSVDFIQRYIFPGGCLPSLASILDASARASDLRFAHAEDFASHYAETLRRWRQAFHQNLESIRSQGFSEEFIRLWDYYLCYCEAGFEERYIGLLQIQLDKPECRRDPVALAHDTATPRFQEIEYSSFTA